MLKKILLWICLLAAIPMAAQELNLRFYHFDEVDTKATFCMEEDKFGFLWMGTFNGLSRHDGKSLVPLNSADPVAQILKTALILGIKSDQNGNIWVATYGQGLAFYDWRKGQFQLFQNDPTDSLSLPTNEITNIHFGKEQELWVATTKGLCLFDKEKENFRIFSHEENNPKTLHNEYLTSILVDRKGEVWVGSPSGISRIVPLGKDEFRIVNYGAEHLPNISVWRLAQASDGGIWVGLVRDGVGKFNPQTEKFERLPTHPGATENLAFHLFEDSRGRLWISFSRDGLVALDLNTKEYSVYKHDPSDSRTIKNDNVYMVLPGKSNRWLAAHAEGISWFYPYDDFFSEKKFLYKEDGETKEVSPSSFCHDGKGSIYIGALMGVFKWDIQEDILTKLGNPSEQTGLATDRDIDRVFEDSKGNIWLGVKTGGPLRWNPQSGELKRYAGRTGAVRAFLEDEKGYIWCGTDGGGVAEIRPGEDSLTLYNLPENENSFPRERIFDMEVMPDGRFWVTDYGKGIMIFDPKTRRYEFPDQDTTNGKTSLSSLFIHDICLMPDGGLYIGTSTGLNYRHPVTGQYTRFCKLDGLPDDYVWSLAVDGENKLWIGTASGLGMLDPETGIFRSFPIVAGIINPAFNARESMFIGQKMYMLEIYGCLVFNPALLSESPPAPKVVLSGFNVLNNSYPLQTAPELLQQLEIGHDDYAFSFDYSCPEAALPEEVEFLVQMEGLDQDWIHVGKRRSAAYTVLPPGDYTFRAKVWESVPSEANIPLEVKLHVRPAFWQTIFFKFLITLAILGVIMAFVWLGKKRLEEQHKKELAQQSAAYKSQFLANMSHEIRTPMHGVMSAAELLSQTSLNQHQNAYLQKIKQAGQNLLSLINDILDFSKIDAGMLDFHPQAFQLEEVLSYVRHTLSEAANQHQNKLILEAAPDLPKTMIGDPVRLGQILINLLGNAIKFTRDGKVSLTVQMQWMEAEKVILVFKVEDTGIGIAPEDLKTIFESFRQAENHYGAEKVGVGLGLAITRQLIEQQGGKIAVSSVQGRGSVFTFSLPFGKALKQAEPVPQLAEDKRGASPTTSKMKSLLLVEDIAMNRELGIDLLKQAFPGTTIDADGSGMEVLDRMKDGYSPDLILMDIRMPEMDGLTCTRHIRSDYDSLLPIMALTASATQEEVQRCLIAGLDGLIPKPFTPDMLTEKINFLMAPVPEGVVLEVDYETLGGFMGNNEERTLRYISSADAEIRKHFKGFRIALSQGDWEQLQIAAHTLKTTFRYLGVAPLADLFDRVEQASEGRDEKLIASLAPQAAKYLRTFLPKLKQG